MTYYNNTRRNFLKVLTTSSVLSATSFPVFIKQAGGNELGNESEAYFLGEDGIPHLFDGPESPLFNPISIEGNIKISNLSETKVSGEMIDAAKFAPRGHGTAWGIPFNISEKVLFLADKPLLHNISPLKTKWLVFLHTSDQIQQKWDQSDFYSSPFKGIGHLKEHVADYIAMYSDGTEECIPVRERFQIGMFQKRWGENCVQAVANHKPMPKRYYYEQPLLLGWGGSQTGSSAADMGQWLYWLYAWENPHPEKAIIGFRFEPKRKTSVIISAITAGNIQTNPIRWEQREKAVLTLPDNKQFDYRRDEEGLLSQLQLDMGQVISVSPRLLYSEYNWENEYNNKIPKQSNKEVLIEYTAHPEAQFHLPDKISIPVSDIKKESEQRLLKQVAPVLNKIKISITEKGTKKLTDVKLHIHGESGEYLPPIDRCRVPNNSWFEDYSVDFVHDGIHFCTYIPGEADIKLPTGKIYIEISKGFEFNPVRKKVEVRPGTKEIKIEIEKILNWREKGWLSADMHVHFLSPGSALLEGSGEGINVVNLLASQWGEMFTNLGDFNGTITTASNKPVKNEECIVRVGTENRQHVLGHISLLGYNGNLITPVTTGGPDESPLGDPVEILLTEWAKQCKQQDGIVVIPHFPDPRLENAATIISGNAHAVEITSLGNLYYGIFPYSLADWYRYLNCGYFVAIVGGTDKMDAGTAIGTARTYSKLREGQQFSYDEWKESIRRGHTFVTYGPLIDFSVNGEIMGSKIDLSASGETVDINWEVASTTIPITKVELIINGKIKRSEDISSNLAKGNWKFKVKNSSWLALLVKGHYPDKPEIILTHSSPVMVTVGGVQMLVVEDAITILEQIEGAMSYIETISINANDKVNKRMRLELESSYNLLQKRIRRKG